MCVMVQPAIIFMIQGGKRGATQLLPKGLHGCFYYSRLLGMLMVLCRYDFTQMLADLDVDDGEQGPQVLADKAFR